MGAPDSGRVAASGTSLTPEDLNLIRDAVARADSWVAPNPTGRFLREWAYIAVLVVGLVASWSVGAYRITLLERQLTEARAERRGLQTQIQLQTTALAVLQVEVSRALNNID